MFYIRLSLNLWEEGYFIKLGIIPELVSRSSTLAVIRWMFRNDPR